MSSLEMKQNKVIFWLTAMLSVFIITTVASSRDVETRTVIAVIDTGVNLEKLPKYLHDRLCKGELHKSMVDDISVFTDNNGHGTNIVGLIAKEIDPTTHCIVMIKFFDSWSSGKTIASRVVDGIKYAVEIKASFLNLSLSGDLPNDKEEEAIKLALSHDINISVAAGNNHRSLDSECNIYPACYNLLSNKNYHVVGSSTGIYSNTGLVVRYHEDGTKVGKPVMSGTSQATAVHTGKWASGKL